MTHTTETEYRVGELVELHATICDYPCPDDCGCLSLAARNGHQGAVLAVQPPMFGGVAYYQVDGIDSLVYGDELRAVTA